MTLALAWDCTAVTRQPSGAVELCSCGLFMLTLTYKISLDSRLQCTAGCLGPEKTQYSSKWSCTDSHACLAFRGRAVSFRERCPALAGLWSLLWWMPGMRSDLSQFPGSTFFEPCRVQTVFNADGCDSWFGLPNCSMLATKFSCLCLWYKVPRLESKAPGWI